MNTVTIPKKEYQNIAQRQVLLEKELAFFKKIVLEAEDGFIRPTILRRWERISRTLDHGGGRSFASIKEMRQWLRKL